MLVALLAAATVAWIILDVSTTLGRSASGPSSQSWSLAQPIVGLLVLLSVLGVLLWRVSSEVDEREVWRWMSVAVALLAVGLAGRLVMTGIGHAGVRVGDWQALPFDICSLLACAAMYQGLVRWNRYRTLMSEPSDWLNGLGSVLAVTALGNLIVRWAGSSIADAPWWQLQGWLLLAAALAVLLGTAVTVVFMGGLIRDRRAWGFSFGFAVVLVCEIISIAHNGLPSAFGGWSEIGWLLGAVAIAWCAIDRPPELNPVAATTQSSTFGALVVMAASVSALMLESVFPEPGSKLPSLYAVAAALSAATRALHIVRALSQLAQTRLEARSDELTGSANRRELMERLHDIVAAGADVALLIIDLDRFKHINDRFGHAAGDELLRVSSDRLQRRMPHDTLLARLGGDEFAVLLTGAGLDEAVSLATTVGDALCVPIELDGYRVSVGASIGIAVMTARSMAVRGPDDGEELLRRADVAMYVAKRAGGGLSVYDVAVDTASQEQAQRLDELRELLTADPDELARQVVVHYQPQVSLRTGAILGAEALVRWQHPRLGLLGPGDFLGMVEEHGLMGALTVRVLNDATSQAVRWRAMGHPLRVSVNLSPSSLTSPELLPIVDHILAAADLEPAALTVEITETSVMVDPELTLTTTKGIASRGIEVSIDDFGTGYSSLSYLSDLPASELKLDRSFTSRLVSDQRTAAIVAGTVQLAHRLGLRVVAEGVEDQATVDVLEQLDCDEVQGYFCGRPMPPDAFDQWLSEHDRSVVGQWA
jgi:diguanylate cyclase (GGDEF)-like protein